MRTKALKMRMVSEFVAKLRFCRSKRPFALLEVIIAISLAALAAPVLFSLPFRLAKREMLSLYESEKARVADREWNLLKLQLLSREISWKDLVKAETQPFQLDETPHTIVFSKEHQQSFVIKKTVTGFQKKSLAAGREGGLVKVKISFHPEKKGKEHSFEYQIAILNQEVL